MITGPNHFLRLSLLALLLCVPMFSLSAQSDPATPEEETRNRVRVNAESAFVRMLPSFDADASASVFENDILEVISRNLDGRWFEVKRPNRLNSLGWIYEDLVDWSFRPETLPLGDITTGLIGPDPLSAPVNFGAYLIEGPALRTAPSLRSERLLNIPPLITIPIIARNQDGTWLRVNYLGYDGWIIGFSARRMPYLLDIPEQQGLPPLATPLVLVIPREIQQAQIDRFREFIRPRREQAAQLEGFWWAVFRGEVMPCEAPPEVAAYIYSDQDVRELPELQRYAPRTITAVTYLNSAIEPLRECGVVDPRQVSISRDASINARIIFDATLEQLDNLEQNVLR